MASLVCSWISLYIAERTLLYVFFTDWTFVFLQNMWIRSFVSKHDQKHSIQDNNQWVISFDGGFASVMRLLLNLLGLVFCITLSVPAISDNYLMSFLYFLQAVRVAIWLFIIFVMLYCKGKKTVLLFIVMCQYIFKQPRRCS